MWLKFPYGPYGELSRQRSCEMKLLIRGWPDLRGAADGSTAYIRASKKLIVQIKMFST
jgi:hypothetical protein